MRKHACPTGAGHSQEGVPGGTCTGLQPAACCLRILFMRSNCVFVLQGPHSCTASSQSRRRRRPEGRHALCGAGSGQFSGVQCTETPNLHPRPGWICFALHVVFTAVPLCMVLQEDAPTLVGVQALRMPQG
jgi:hypothetical protein